MEIRNCLCDSSFDCDSLGKIESASTLTRALQEQLGLKLESKKGPIDTIVIDHMEKTPIEN